MSEESSQEIVPISLETEMKQSYLDYAMSVIVGRALPNVRDGLKPVHRRVLYAMYELNNDWNKPYKKSARVVGDVIGKYHPHGDGPVYDTLVRMAQDFAMRYLLIDGQGNFGSIDGDAPAAMRYTEVRMAKIAHQMLADIEKETVNFIDNYDESDKEPEILPTRLPLLLINGSSGIAVGMATNIPPHNIGEILQASIALLQDETISIDELLQHVKGPDFPTGAIINGLSGIVQAYKTGRGKVRVRSKVDIEQDKSGKQKIIVREIPYAVNKAKLIERIADLVKDKKITSISALRDESDKDGIRIVIELKRGEIAEVELNKLLKYTNLETVFSINMVALVDGQPRLLNLKDILHSFIQHRKEIVIKRTVFEYGKARERAHILEGLTVALANIDEIITLIKESSTPQIAKQQLLEKQWNGTTVASMLKSVDINDIRPNNISIDLGLVDNKQYRLSPVQAQAILDMRLHRLTGLEQEKITQEFSDLIDKIADLLEILRVTSRLLEVIHTELQELSDTFNDPRRTVIDEQFIDMEDEDLIAEEDRIVSLSRDGYIKSQPLTEYRIQARGGKGKSSSNLKETDEVGLVCIASTHAMLLCFSSVGKVYWKKSWQIPTASRAAKGLPIVNIIPLDENEKITAILPIDKFESGISILKATKFGVVKKSALMDYSRPRSNGIIAIKLDEGDELVGCSITQETDTIMLFSSDGKAVHFQSALIREQGRNSRGSRGIRLAKGKQMISLQVPKQTDDLVLTVTENGYGKLTPVADYPIKGRGLKGVISIKCSSRNGEVINSVIVQHTQQVILITNKGTLMRIPLDNVSVISRNTQGVRLMNLSGDEKLVDLAIVDCSPDDGDSDDASKESS